MNEDLKRAKYSLSSLESLIDQLNTTLYTSELSNGETSSTSNSVIEEELRYRTAPAANGVLLVYETDCKQELPCHHLSLHHKGDL
jgi:hypothetical protein